jgi:hypothetical protein
MTGVSACKAAVTKESVLARQIVNTIIKVKK